MTCEVLTPLRMSPPRDKISGVGPGYPRNTYMLVKLQSAISLFTCGCLVSVAASPSGIGVVVTSGQAQVDGAVVRGNSTLFQGNLVQAGQGTSDLMFPGGSNLLLQPGSAVRVFREYGVLDHGAAVQRGSNTLIADGLKISSLSPQGAVFVAIQDGSRLSVAAQGGAAEVRNPSGDLVARLEPGKALSFAIQAGPQGSTGLPQTPPTATTTGQSPGPAGVQMTIHGILRTDHPGRYGHYLLTDIPSKVTYELQGPGLDDLVGASVEVTGSTFDTAPAEGASKVLSVSDIHQMPLSEITGTTTPTPSTPAAAPPTPTGDTPPPSTAGPEVGATPEATAPPEPNNGPAVAPLPQHHDTAKVLVIVALAAGAVVGVALGLGGGKSSTVSPA